ncbi:type II toxin-antitoxin system VapC family toxin [Sphingomonas sp. RS2018]
MIFLDTNILMDVLEESETIEGLWSRRLVASKAESEPFVSNLIVVAELSGQMDDPDGIGVTLSNAGVDLADLNMASALRAGAAFVEYRRRGGAKQTILPDFLIAAHAIALGASLMTRDRRLASYFPDLTLITPETHP